MIELEKQLRQTFEEMVSLGTYDWKLLDEVKRLHRFNKLGQKLSSLTKTK